MPCSPWICFPPLLTLDMFLLFTFHGSVSFFGYVGYLPWIYSHTLLSLDKFLYLSYIEYVSLPSLPWIYSNTLLSCSSHSLTLDMFPQLYRARKQLLALGTLLQ